MNIIFETLDSAEIGRKEILDFMLETIGEPRDHVSEFAPKIVSFKVPLDKVRDVIGKWGEMINKIIDLSWGVKIDFEEDGTCLISDNDMTKIKKAEELIKDITEDLPINQEIEWVISRVEKYGVFVNLPKKKSWLCHIKSLAVTPGSDLERQFKEWDKIKIIITEIDKQGRYNLKRVK